MSGLASLSALILTLESRLPLPVTSILLRAKLRRIQDGSLGARTAFCCDPYPGTKDHGLWIYPDLELASMLAFGTSYSFKLAVHAIGDEANSRTLAAFAALDPPPLTGSSIEHAQMLLPSDFSMFGKLGLIASIQPEHLLDDIELADRFWEGRTSRAFPYRFVSSFPSISVHSR